MKFSRFVRKRFQSSSSAKPRRFKARRRPLVPLENERSRKKRKRFSKVALKSAEKIHAPAAPEASQPVNLPVQLVAAPTAQIALIRADFFSGDGPIRRSIESFLLDQRSVHTRNSYGKDLKRFMKFMATRPREQQLDRALIIAYKEFLLFEKLAHTTVDRHLATLRSFFDWLVEDGLLMQNPATKVRFLSPRRLSTTRGFSDAEVLAILAKPDLHRRTGALHYAILLVLFYCGLRRSELCDLMVSDVSSERGQYVLKLIGKGNRERLIPIIKPVKSALDYYFFITGRKWDEGDVPLFAPIRNHRTGILKKKLDPSHIFYVVKRYARLAGIKERVSPHSCRATAISNARDHHVPDRAIQEFAGWTSPDMITRYDKRKTSIEESAALSIDYQEKTPISDETSDPSFSAEQTVI